jgi:hypothetical protein
MATAQQPAAPVVRRGVPMAERELAGAAKKYNGYISENVSAEPMA